MITIRPKIFVYPIPHWTKSLKLSGFCLFRLALFI